MTLQYPHNESYGGISMKRRIHGIWEHVFVTLVLLVLAAAIVGVINLGDKLWGGSTSAGDIIFPSQQTVEIDLSEYLGSETVPLFFQFDERWGNTIYGSDVMTVTGCGPTCLSMVLVHLLQDTTFTPRYVADFAEINHYYAKGSGSKWALISEGGKALGLNVTELPLDENRIKKNLELGNPVICIMGPGQFTTAGHFIVLVGLEEGKFKVNDPNSKENSERLWSYEEISGEIKNLWACQKPEQGTDD